MYSPSLYKQLIDSRVADSNRASLNVSARLAASAARPRRRRLRPPWPALTARFAL